MEPLTINIDPLQLTDEQFFQLCVQNRDLKFEQNANGDLIVMPPTGGETGNRNAEIIYQLQAWTRQNGTGIAFDSSTGFILPNGAKRSPDAAWIPLERWNQLSLEQQRKFLPLCPEFVIELLSPTDQLKTIQEKMREYRDNGTRLGWLINRQQKQVEIYRSDQEVETLNTPRLLSGENILLDFNLNLEPIW